MCVSSQKVFFADFEYCHMKMDVSQNSPIVIHSDDDDDDDDVVLVKAEKAPEDAKKRDEDDVIFISEETSASVQKCTLENQKNKRRLTRRSSSSSSDDDNSCVIPQIKYFQTEFSSVSLVDDILRPLDLSQGTVQATEVLPTVISHKLSLLKPVQAACSSTVFQEQGESPLDKAVDDIEMNPGKILHDFEISSVKTIDNTFTGRSARVDRFAPLKLPEVAEPLSSQTLNTPMCKIDPGKECFNLCSQVDTDVNQTTSQLFDTSSTSSQSCTDKSFSVKEKQDASASFFSGSGKWYPPQRKQVVGAYESSTNLAQDMDINSDDRVAGFASDLLIPSPAAPSDLGKTVTSDLDLGSGTSELDQGSGTSEFYHTLGTSDDVNSDGSNCSVLMPTNSYLSEVNSQPGTSKQFTSLSSSHSSQPPPVTAKLHVPKSKTSLTSNGSSLTLDFNNLSTEDFSSLLDFFSDENDSSPLDDSKADARDSNESGQPLKESDKTTEQTNSTCPVQTDVCSSKASSIASRPSPENLLAESETLQQDNRSLSSSRHFKAGPVQTGCRETLEKSSIPSVSSSSSKRQNILKTLKDRLSAIEHSLRYSSYIRNHKKIPSPHARCLSSSQLTVNSLSSKQRYHKYLVDRVRKYKARHSKGEFGSWNEQHPGQARLTSVSKNLDVKVEKTDPAQWQIVSLKPREKRSRSRASSLNDHRRPTKRIKVMQNSPGDKPGLKMRLKFSPVTAEQTCHPDLPAQIQPSNNWLKISRQHSSMTGDTLVRGVQPHTSMHRSVSESGLKKHKTEENYDQILCVTCKRTVTSTKLSKCSKGHCVCTTCLEAQVKSILTGEIKQKYIRCPASACIEILSFDELKRALPSFVVDILEEKLDKEYLSYITKWMFTDEELKSRSEFATSDTRMPPCPALSMRKYEEIYTQESRDPTEDLPTFWTPMERGAPVMVFEVVPDTEEYRALAFQFHETLNFGDFDIVRIIRVQNPILWKYFALKRSEMVQENDGMDVTEKQLYHGTHRSTLEAIARKGFDWRLSGKHGTVYGCGSYFAKTSRYSHGYTDRAGNGLSVKSGSGPGRIIQPNLGLTSLGMGFTSSANYLTRIHSRVQTFFNFSQPPLMQLVPPMITSQNQPPQPPPAHYHLPAPPPAHGQMSSLQVPAHNHTSNPVANKGATISGSATSQCANSNPPFVKILSAASTSSSVPTVPGPSIAMPVFIQPKLNNYHSCLNSTKTLFSEQLCNSLDFQPAAQPSFSTLDSQFSSASFCPTQTLSFQAQPSISGSRNIYSSPSTSCSKLGLLPSSCMTTFSVGDMLRTSRNQLQTKHGATRSSGTKGQDETKQSSSSMSTKLRDHERGTADLTSSFARDATSETHFMFVARVLVGRHTGGKTGLKRPPPLDENNPFGKSYDSCVDNIFYPQVFVIFDSNQAYPEYVIEYNWHKD